MSDTEPDMAGLADALPDVEPHGNDRESPVACTAQRPRGAHGPRPFRNSGICVCFDFSSILKKIPMGEEVKTCANS